MSRTLAVSQLLLTASTLLADSNFQAYSAALERTYAKYGSYENIPDSSIRWLAKTYKQELVGVRANLKAKEETRKVRENREKDSQAQKAKQEAKDRAPAVTPNEIAKGSPHLFEDKNFGYRFLGNSRVRIYPRRFLGSFRPAAPGKKVSSHAVVKLKPKGRVARGGSIGVMPFAIKGATVPGIPFAYQIETANHSWDKKLQDLSPRLRDLKGKPLPESEMPLPGNLNYWLYDGRIVDTSWDLSKVKRAP